MLISRRDLDRADEWFRRRGEVTVFVGRLLPVVRTFIAFPAGVARMPIWRFLVYTFAGTVIWCIPLTAVGYYLGPRWDAFRSRVRYIDDATAILILLAIV